MPRGTSELKRTPMPPGRAKPRRYYANAIPESVRRLVLARDDRCCVRCGVSVIGQRYSLHHRKPRSQGGEHTTANLITLCGTGTTGCHGWAESFRERAREAGWLVPRSTEPAAVQVQTWQHGLAWPGDTWIPVD